MSELDPAVVVDASEGLRTQAELTSCASVVAHLSSDSICVHLHMQVRVVVHEVLPKEPEELP